ncbi:hypothetical protein LS77_011310 [Helicobacter bilis]|uniref:Uncharacterized protein n=2 Tax=Helicobacter bilis TaxID=37372 RepID=N2BGL0_9HELI|nr:hypothetical protein [Helicobacter bilis]EMZ37550.1 hypothetical protein C826_02116 [Helicobacter bilis WiWa]EMZ38576.1 hypothetical protein C826_01614 [Helicobacter bilis WiWa]TLE01995.1 hypothetical protein LS77_011310 [Helicobacter bilis]TLE02540.1 hypothetical protein LS76_011275 [Helicobacter bilis]
MKENNTKQQNTNENEKIEFEVFLTQYTDTLNAINQNMQILASSVMLLQKRIKTMKDSMDNLDTQINEMIDSNNKE